MHLGLGGIPSSMTPLLLQERSGSLIRTSREPQSLSPAQPSWGGIDVIPGGLLAR